MNINYIILAHQNPYQLKRLVLKLLEPWTYFYIHIDSNTDIKPFHEVLKDYPKVHFLENRQREKGTWGDMGIVKATLNSMNKVKSDSRSGYTVLLSGQDYPLKNNNFIRSFFKRHFPTCFISLFELPHPIWNEGGFDRLRKYKINKSEKRGHFIQLPSVFEKQFYSQKTAGNLNFLRKAGKFSDMVTVLKKRKFPNYLKPYGGGQWWALPMEMIEHILHFTEMHPDYEKYHKYTLLPDEIFFHSIIAEELTKHQEFKIGSSVTYVNWERPFGPLPVMFTRDDLKELRIASKEKLFARKFDCKQDEKILDLIDEELIKKSC